MGRYGMENGLPKLTKFHYSLLLDGKLTYSLCRSGYVTLVEGTNHQI